MITFMILILNHENWYHHVDYYYTVILYSETKNYDTLILDIFCDKLWSLKEFELEISETLWKFKLYFSLD